MLRIFNNKITRGEDFHLWVSIALRFKVVYLNKCLSFYNQDVDSSTRLTKKLHPPESNYVFYFDEFKKAESKDYNLKILLDHIRLKNYLKYLSSGKYFSEAKKLSNCIDIKAQPNIVRIFLSLPENAQILLMRYHTVKSKSMNFLKFLRIVE